MVRTEDSETLEAAERAGVEMVSVTPEMMVDLRFREMAPTVFAVPGVDFFELGTADDFTRWAFRMLKATADAVYVSAGLPTIRQLAADNIPVISHVGLIPSRATWTGRVQGGGQDGGPGDAGLPGGQGPRGARVFPAEIEVVPAEMAAEISKRTSLFMVSMGSLHGRGLPVPVRRGHAGREPWAHSAPRQDLPQLRRPRPPAPGGARGGVQGARGPPDVHTGAYPDDRNIVGTDPAELEAFRRALALAGEADQAPDGGRGGDPAALQRAHPTATGFIPRRRAEV